MVKSVWAVKAKAESRLKMSIGAGEGIEVRNGGE
jgi:hypothetical protein